MEEKGNTKMVKKLTLSGIDSETTPWSVISVHSSSLDNNTRSVLSGKVTHYSDKAALLSSAKLISCVGL